MAATDVDGPITATAPTGVTASSAVVGLFSTSSDADVSALSGPAGWVKLGEHAGSGSLPNVTVWAWWPDGVTLPTYEFTKPADVLGVVTLGRVEGVNPLSPVDVQLQWAADCDDTDTMPAPAVTTLTADTLVINFYVATTASAPVAPPPPPPPDPTPETLSVFWSGSEIDLARTRAAGVSNFEWDAVKQHALDYWASPNGSMLAGFNPMECGQSTTAQNQQRQAIDAALFADRVAAAATVELATGRTDRLSTIGNALVTQMGKPNFDFENRAKYPLNCTDNSEPGFHLDGYVGKLIVAMDTIEVLGYSFSTADRAAMATRLHGLAEVGCKDATTKMLQFYGGSSSARANRATPTSGAPSQTVYYYDGTGLPRVSAIALALNNRRATRVAFAAMVQAWTGNTQWDSHIRLWQQDMMDYGYAPEYAIHPGMPDFYRGITDTAPWKAAHYTGMAVGMLGLVAEMYRRGQGDMWLYDYRTTRGILESTKTKAYGILDAIQHFCSYAWKWRAVKMQGIDFGTSWTSTGYEDMDFAFIPEALRPAVWNGANELARTGVVATRGRGSHPMYQAFSMVPAVWFLRAPR
jgi:hypothetical protein